MDDDSSPPGLQPSNSPTLSVARAAPARTDAGSNLFRLDEAQLDAESPAPVVAHAAAPAATAPAAGFNSALAVWCIVGALLVITALLGWLVVMLRRSGLGASGALVPLGASAPDAAGLDAQSKLLREKMAAELTEFARQSLVQGLYAQRTQLMELQQRAQAEIAALEARLNALHLPLKERIRAYETRVSELEKELETRDEEMRNLIRATLLLVRERLDTEKSKAPGPARFN